MVWGRSTLIQRDQIGNESEGATFWLSGWKSPFAKRLLYPVARYYSHDPLGITLCSNSKLAAKQGGSWPLSKCYSKAAPVVPLSSSEIKHQWGEYNLDVSFCLYLPFCSGSRSFFLQIDWFQKERQCVLCVHGGGEQRETAWGSQADSALSAEPTRSSISWPWDHDLSGNQESDAQPTVPPRSPWL